VLEDGAGWLAFESNYDGPVDDHLRELLRVGAKAIRRMYGECEGYPLAQAARSVRAITRRSSRSSRQGALPSAAFHVGVHARWTNDSSTPAGAVRPLPVRATLFAAPEAGVTAS
jgi:hypothetical protein